MAAVKHDRHHVFTISTTGKHVKFHLGDGRTGSEPTRDHGESFAETVLFLMERFDLTAKTIEIIEV